MGVSEFEIDLHGVPGARVERVAVTQDQDRPSTLRCVGLLGGERVALGALYLNALSGFLTPAEDFDTARLVCGPAILELHRHLRRFLRERSLLR